MDEDDRIHPGAAVAPGYLANHAARLFNRVVDNALRPHGMSIALLGPLLLLHWKGAMLQRDLVRLSAVKQPAMVALLDKLEGMKMIERTAIKADRRAATVSLTDRGHAVAEMGGNILTDTNQLGLEGFSEGEVVLFVQMLQRLISNLDGA